MKIKYDWSKVPKEVKWIATDADGVINGFYEKPNPNHQHNMWFECLDCTGRAVCLGEWYHDICAEWQDSLEERPNDI